MKIFIELNENSSDDDARKPQVDKPIRVITRGAQLINNMHMHKTLRVLLHRLTIGTSADNELRQ